MSTSLSDILANRDFDMPPEVRAIKEYVQRYYDVEVNVTVQSHAIIVSSKSAGLIGSLRMNLPKLQDASGTDKRIIFRVS